MNDLFNPDGLEQEHLSDQGSVELITAPEILEVGEDDNYTAYIQHPKCPMFKHTEARIIFVKCGCAFDSRLPLQIIIRYSRFVSQRHKIMRSVETNKKSTHSQIFINTNQTKHLSEDSCGQFVVGTFVTAFFFDNLHRQLPGILSYTNLFFLNLCPKWSQVVIEEGLKYEIFSDQENH